MAEIWGAALVAGATVATTAYSSNRAGRAADAQGRASRDAIAAQTESERRALQMQEPFYEAGYAATAAMMDMTGLDRSRLGGAARLSSAEDRGVQIGDTLLPEGTTTKEVGKGWHEVWNGGQRIGTLRPGGQSGRFVNDTNFDVGAAFRASAGNAAAEESPADLSSYDRYNWQTDPGYQFRLDEGTRTIERSAAARGILNSGGTLRSATRYAQDYASNEYQRVFDRISSIAGRGQSAANAGSNVIVGTGENVGRALVNAGDARASGYVAQGNAWSNLANQGMALYGHISARNHGVNPGLSTPPYAGGDPYGYYRGNGLRLS